MLPHVKLPFFYCIIKEAALDTGVADIYKRNHVQAILNVAALFVINVMILTCRKHFQGKV